MTRNSCEAKPYCLLKTLIKFFPFSNLWFGKFSAAYQLHIGHIPNPVYTIYTFPNMATSNILSKEPQAQYIFTTTLCTYMCSIIHIQSISLQNIVNNSIDTKVRRILICSSVRCAYTWKIVFKTQNNELNELSECMLYKMFTFPENISKL